MEDEINEQQINNAPVCNVFKTVTLSMTVFLAEDYTYKNKHPFVFLPVVKRAATLYKKCPVFIFYIINLDNFITTLILLISNISCIKFKCLLLVYMDELY